MARHAAILPWLLAACGSAAHAETAGVYHPYVNAGEREIEYGLVMRDIDGDDVSLQRVSMARSWSDRFSTEWYVLSEFPSHEASRRRAMEFEARWQLTEQGEFAADWGLLLEAEIGRRGGPSEVAAGVLWEKELGQRWVAAANLLAEYEFGSSVDNEFETALRAQLRRRVRPAFEPALELYLDDEDKAAGPALLGAVRLAPGTQIRWEAGVYFGISRDTPSASMRIGVELEF